MFWFIVGVLLVVALFTGVTVGLVAAVKESERKQKFESE